MSNHFLFGNFVENLAENLTKNLAGNLASNLTSNLTKNLANNTFKNSSGIFVRVLKKSALVTTVLLGSVVFTSCGGASPSSTKANVPTQMAPESAPQNAAIEGSNKEAADTSRNGNPNPAANVSVAKPQLIKSARLDLVVVSVEEGIKSVGKIVQQYQGDVLSLEDNQANSRQLAVLQLRIPQEKLDITLESLAKLGTIENRSLSSEDVSNQLVDLRARLKNLRKTEEALLEIMNRSGSVGDVLKVAQEVSNVRQSIEQIDAQLQNLQNRVAYSLVSINLRALATTRSTTPSLGLQFQETWQQATTSVGNLTIGLMKLLLWLLVYSPYLGLIILGGYGARYWFRRSVRAAAPEISQD